VAEDQPDDPRRADLRVVLEVGDERGLERCRVSAAVVAKINDQPVVTVCLEQSECLRGELLEPVARQALVVLQVHGVLCWQDFQPVGAGSILLVQRQRDKIQGLRVLQPVGRPVCLPGRAERIWAFSVRPARVRTVKTARVGELVMPSQFSRPTSTMAPASSSRSSTGSS
jgi:hypothetical protein